MSTAASSPLLDRRRSVTAEKGRRRRTALLYLLAGAACLAGGWWMLTGPPGRIASVEVSGYDGPQAKAVAGTLRRVAERGSVIDPPTDLMRRSMAGYPWVDDLHVRRRLPRGISVVVVPATPAAVAVPSSGPAMLLSSSGRVLGRIPKKNAPSVLRVRVGDLKLAPGGRLEGDVVAAALALSANLTPATGGRLVALRSQRGALVGRLAEGPEVRFGLMQDLPAKAEALELVLGQLSRAEEEAAVYIDLSVPWFPAVGDRAAAAASQPAPPAPPATAEPSTTP